MFTFTFNIQSFSVTRKLRIQRIYLEAPHIESISHAIHLRCRRYGLESERKSQIINYIRQCRLREQPRPHFETSHFSPLSTSVGENWSKEFNANTCTRTISLIPCPHWQRYELSTYSGRRYFCVLSISNKQKLRRCGRFSHRTQNSGWNKIYIIDFSTIISFNECFDVCYYCVLCSCNVEL